MKKIDDLPKETIDTVKRLIKKGYIVATDGIVNLTDDTAYVLLILDRADVFN